MTIWTGPDGFVNVQDDLLTAIAAELVLLGPDHIPDRVCRVPGEIAWDGCECGQLVTSLFRWFPSSTFPQRGLTPDPIVGGCPPPFIVGVLRVSLLRCAPPVPDGALAPTCEALDASAVEVAQDAHLVMSTTTCRLEELKDDNHIVDYLISEQLAAGPAGNCVGSVLTVGVALDWSA